MLVSNPMRFCTDIFGVLDENAEVDDSTEDEGSSHSDTAPIKTTFNKQALLISNDYLDCTNKSAVTGFEIKGIEPAGTKRRFAFKIENKIYPLTNTGALGTAIANVDTYTLARITAKVLSDGNSSGELGALTSVPALVGKKVYPVIALEAPSDSEDFPTAHFKLKAQTANETLTLTKESVVFDLTQDTENVPRISEITADYPCTGNGSMTIRVKLKNADGSWTDYMTLSAAADRDAVAVQFKFTYKVTTADGSDSATVKQIVVDHTLGKTVVSGDNADLYSTVIDYDVPLQMAYVVVRHYPLADSRIEAYVNFMPPPLRRELIQIGTTTGSLQELTLGVGGVPDPRIDASSIQIFVDGELITDFNFNSEVSTVALKAKKNFSIFASYDYNHGVENWRKMTLEGTEPYTDEETVMSRFTYTLPDSQAQDKTVSNVRIRMIRTSGTVSNAALGKATGKRQLFVLAHQPKVSSIAFSDPAVDFSFDSDSQILSVVAPKNTNLIISYKWNGEPVNIRSFAAGWALH